MTDTLHPARSTDFLSRLYDGELAEAERDAFAAHRSACEECREAADAFAAALAAFRASPTVPPAADLSARILRKIRAQSPSRRPFGVMFGIDVRWAGALIAALLVVLISTPLVLRRPETVAVAPSSIPARILDAPAQAKARTPQERGNVTREAPASGPAPAAPPALLSKDESPAAKLAEAPRPKPGAGEGPADEEKRRYAPAPPAAQAAPTLRGRMTGEPSGGEAASTDAVEVSLRLAVRPFDGEGPAPAIVSHPPDARLADLRGLEFVLTVEASGRVRAVQSSTGNGLVLPRKAPSDGESTVAGPGDALRELRFAPGDRPRRLLIRID